MKWNDKRFGMADLKQSKRKKTDWEKFQRLEREYEINRLRKLSPLERIKILEDIYILS